MDKQELMEQLLANMTERAEKAERERDEAQSQADSWYRLYKMKRKMCNRMSGRLAQMREELQKKEAELEQIHQLTEQYKQLEKQYELLADRLLSNATREKEDTANA